MKKIMMNKYGFERWPEEDFSDDGNRFTCYKVGERVRVSKCTYNGKVFISARIDGTMLPFDVYSKLVHYSALDALNGVSISSLTDEDLFNLYEACLAYEKEYDEAEANIKMPAIADIEAQCLKIKAKRTAELKEIEELLNNNIVNLATELSDYQWRNLKGYLVRINELITQCDPDVKVPALVNTSISFNFCKPDYSELNDSYYYKYIIDMISGKSKSLTLHI